MWLSIMVMKGLSTPQLSSSAKADDPVIAGYDCVYWMPRLRGAGQPESSRFIECLASRPLLSAHGHEPDRGLPRRPDRHDAARLRGAVRAHERRPRLVG